MYIQFSQGMFIKSILFLTLFSQFFCSIDVAKIWCRPLDVVDDYIKWMALGGGVRTVTNNEQLWLVAVGNGELMMTTRYAILIQWDTAVVEATARNKAWVDDCRSWEDSRIRDREAEWRRVVTVVIISLVEICRQKKQQFMRQCGRQLAFVSLLAPMCCSNKWHPVRLKATTLSLGNGETLPLPLFIPFLPASGLFWGLLFLLASTIFEIKFYFVDKSFSKKILFQFFQFFFGQFLLAPKIGRRFNRNLFSVVCAARIRISRSVMIINLITNQLQPLLAMLVILVTCF